MAKTKMLKKEWHTIKAPKIFRSTVLGESLVYEPQQMIGKSIVKNLMSLTNDVKKQNINIDFQIVGVEKGEALTNIKGYNLVHSSVRRWVRRGVNKIEISFNCKTSDKKTVRVKPIFVTRTTTSGSVATRLREEAKAYLEKYCAGITYDTLTNDLIGHKIQSVLRAHLKKIYPLKVCEIKSMRVIDEKKAEKPKADKKEGSD